VLNAAKKQPKTQNHFSTAGNIQIIEDEKSESGMTRPVQSRENKVDFKKSPAASSKGKT
jgi:hypothetical protein